MSTWKLPMSSDPLLDLYRARAIFVPPEQTNEELLEERNCVLEQQVEDLQEQVAQLQVALKSAMNGPPFESRRAAVNVAIADEFLFRGDKEMIFNMQIQRAIKQMNHFMQNNNTISIDNMWRLTLERNTRPSYDND